MQWVNRLPFVRLHTGVFSRIRTRRVINLTEPLCWIGNFLVVTPGLLECTDVPPVAELLRADGRMATPPPPSSVMNSRRFQGPTRPRLDSRRQTALRLTHHRGAAFDGFRGRDEAACPVRGRRTRRPAGDRRSAGIDNGFPRRDEAARSVPGPRMSRATGGVADSPRRAAARSVARCNNSRVHSHP